MGGKQSTNPSPAPAAGSTGANSTPSPASASAPGWMVASAPWAFWGSLIILTSLALRWIPFNWGLMLLFAILGGGASLLLKKSKTISFFRWMAGGIILTTILSAWFFPQLPAAVESYQPGVPSPQEQVNQSPSPTPTPRATHRVIASGEVIVLDRNKTITIPEGRKSLCFSYLGIPGDKMSNQELNLGEEFFSEMGTVCKDISHLSGKVSVVMYPKDSWSSQQVRDWYRGWKNQPGGQGEFPVIRIGE